MHLITRAAHPGTSARTASSHAGWTGSREALRGRVSPKNRDTDAARPDNLLRRRRDEIEDGANA